MIRPPARAWPGFESTKSTAAPQTLNAAAASECGPIPTRPTNPRQQNTRKNVSKSRIVVRPRVEPGAPMGLGLDFRDLLAHAKSGIEKKWKLPYGLRA